MNNAYHNIDKLVKLKSTINDAKEFHRIVNVVFHNCEAEYYDRAHKEMWESLQDQVDLAVSDILAHTSMGEIKLLDVGCGTGLASHFLKKSAIGSQITEIHLLDTSAIMLKKAARRAKSWACKVKIIEGDVGQVDGYYDIIVISSVLHHIPNLSGFFENISQLQNTGAILITIHDPYMEALVSDTYKNRCSAYFNSINSKLSFYDKVKYKLNAMFALPNYIEKANRILLKQGIINQPLTEVEMWSITDVHVEGLPYSANNGVSKQFMIDQLDGYQLNGFRTYGFYGTLYSNLNNEFKKKEKALIATNDQNGRNFSSTWIKN